MRSSTTPVDLYSVFGLEFGAPIAQVKSAYRRLIRVSHPDVGGDRGTFEVLTLAYEFLSDPERKAAYDAAPPGSSHPEADPGGSDGGEESSGRFEDRAAYSHFGNGMGFDQPDRVTDEELRMHIYRLEDLTILLKRTLRDREKAAQRRARVVWWRRWPALTVLLAVFGLAIIPQLVGSVSLSSRGTDHEWLQYTYYLGHVIFYGTVAAIAVFAVSRMVREARAMWARHRLRREHFREMS